MTVYSSFKKLASVIWKTDFERKGISDVFNPVFYKVIGIENTSEYDSILNFLNKKIQSCSNTVFFNGSIEMSADFDLISYLGNELSNMDLNNLETADITMFNDVSINKKFLKSLQKIIQEYESKNTFMNKSIKIDFIIKMILWFNMYAKKTYAVDNSTCSKCIYYGSISKHEVYFLLFLYDFGFDVVYINPLKDDLGGYINYDFINQILSQQIDEIRDFNERIKNVREINLDSSTTVQLMDEIQENMFTGTGIYRPWQLRDYSLQPVKKQLTIFDFWNTFVEPAKIRDGFRVEGNTVYVPNLFFQIDGIYSNEEEYEALIKSCIGQPNVLMLNDRGESLIQGEVTEDEKLKLVFCAMTDHVYSIEEIQKLSFYKWKNFNESDIKLMNEAINRVFSDKLIENELSPTQEYNIIADILCINQEIIKMVDSYDYSDKIPKIIIFLENEDFISERIMYILCYIYELGFDIIIFNPSGLMSLKSVINKNAFNYARLDSIVYNACLETYKKSKISKKGFFSRFFS